MPQVPEPVASLLFFDQNRAQLKNYKFKDDVRQWVQPRVEAWKEDFPGERDWPQEWDEDKEAWRAARDKVYKLHELNQKGKAGPDEAIGALFPQDAEGPAARDIREQMFPGAVGDASSPRPSTAQTPAERNVTTPPRESSPDGASTPKPTVIVSRSREGDDASLLSDSPSRQPNTPSRGILSRLKTWATANQPDLDPSPSTSPAADVSSSIDDSTHDNSGFSHEEHEESMTTIGRNTPTPQERPETTIDSPKEAATQAPNQLTSSLPTQLDSSSLDGSGISPAVQDTQTKESRRGEDTPPKVERSGQSQARTVRARAPPRPGASRHTKSPSPRTAQGENKTPEGLTATAPDTEISHPKTAKTRIPPRPGLPPRQYETPPPATAPEKGREGVESKGQTRESSNSMQERLDQQQQQIVALKEMIKNLSITQPQQGQVLTRTKVKVIPTNYNRFYLPTGGNKPVQLSKPQRALRFPDFNPTQWFGDKKVRELQERMKGALDKNYLAINYLRPENFSQCSSIQTDLRYWFYIADPDVTPSYVAARASGEVDQDGRLLADDGLPVNKRRYVWACAFGINKKNQLALEMEGLDGRPFSRCRTTNDSTLITKFKDLTDDQNLRWVTNKELQDLAKEELWINRQLIGPDNGSVRPDRAYEVIVWNDKEERPCFKWASLADLQKRFGADMKEMIQNVAARKVDQPDIW